MSHFCGPNDKQIYRLVLTGGPNGGKTTGQSRLSTFFESLGWRVYRVPQILSALTSGGYKALDTDLSEEASCRLNENLLKLIIQVENTYYEMACSASENCIVISDGGTMDVRARLSLEQWGRILQANGWNDVTLRDSRYNQVIHMVSHPPGGSSGADGGMGCLSNTATDLKRQDVVVSQAWVGHPYYDVVDNSTDLDMKIKRMISVVCYRLNIQIGDRLAVDSHKRKFLVSSVPDCELFPPFQDFTVIHDYLASPNQKMQARVRRRGQNADVDLHTPVTPVGCIQLDVDQQLVFIVGTDADLNNWTYTHTVRCTQSDNRNRDSSELKMLISPREYDLLLAQKDAERFTVFKTRRCFLWNNQYFQLDIYKEPCPLRCRGLIMLETYTALKGTDFELPSFLDVVREVTGDPTFSMYNLSRKLCPLSAPHFGVFGTEHGDLKAVSIRETDKNLGLGAVQEEASEPSSMAGGVCSERKKSHLGKTSLDCENESVACHTKMFNCSKQGEVKVKRSRVSKNSAMESCR